MSVLQEFSRLKDIAGVAEYILVRQDGHIMVHDTTDEDGLGQIVMLCGTNCDAIEANIPSRFNYFIFTRECGEHLLVFPVGSYYLGVVQTAAVESSHVALTVSEFIRKLLNPGK